MTADDRPAELERRYRRAEERLEPQRRRSTARGPVGLLAVLVVLVLAVAVVVAVDLRRLQTPRGTALAWTGAAVLGICDTYRRLSVAPADGLRPDTRTDAERCRDLREQTARNREQQSQIGIFAGAVTRSGREATVVVEVRRPEGTEQVSLPLVRRGAGWAVVRTPAVCLAIGCA